MAWTFIPEGSTVVHVGWRISRTKKRSESTGTNDRRIVAQYLRRAQERERAAMRGLDPTPPKVPQDVLKDFLDSRTRGHRSEDTVRFYRERLQPLVTAWKDRPWEEWTRAAFEAWLDERRAAATAAKRKPAGAGGDHATFRACRAWIGWGRTGGSPPPDFLEGFAEPIVSSAELEPLDEHQVLKLVDAAEGREERTALALAALAGLRWKEISRATWPDLDLAGETLRVHRKTRRTVRLDLHPRLVEILKEAASVKRLAGEPLEGPLVTMRRLDLAAAYAKAEISYPRYPLRLLRHSLISNLLARGVASQDVRDIAGHANLRTTDRYAHSNAARRREALRTTGLVTKADAAAKPG